MKQKDIKDQPLLAPYRRAGGAYTVPDEDVTAMQETCAFWRKQRAGINLAAQHYYMRRLGLEEEVAKKWHPYVPSLTDFCMSDDSIDHPVIDNDNYVYFLYVYMMKDAMLYGVKVEYEYSAP